MNATIDLGGRSVGRLGFGAMRVMGAKGPDGAPSREAAIELVRRVVELGVTFIDTADIYGNGASEEIIAEALHPYPEDLMIATKGGFLSGQPGPGGELPPVDGRPEWLRRACEESLRRLRVERIDLYQLHAPDEKVPFEESIGALADLRAEGKIARIGVSNVNRRQIATAADVATITSVQNRYNRADRASERVVGMCEERGIAFLPWGPIQVADDSVVAEVATEVGATPQQVALAWLLRRSPVMLPIPGTSSVSHLEENMAAGGIELSDGQLSRLGL